ncbi:MAG: ester cyclase [Pseudomonadota bacterium]
MTEVQAAKDLVRAFWYRGPTLPDLSLLHPGVSFHGPAPIGHLTGAADLERHLYQPLTTLFSSSLFPKYSGEELDRRSKEGQRPSIMRDAYMFLGGTWQGQTWVATTGQITGPARGRVWRLPDLGGQVANLRFGEFYRIAEGEIVEIRCLYDILGLLAQCGHRLLPPFEGRPEIPQGPAKKNGLRYDPSPEHETQPTLDLVEAMLGGCNRLNGSDLASMGMAAFWHGDMRWCGPWGVGETRGFQEFQDHAQGPSVRSFPDRRGGFHVARFADGPAAAFTGWPSLRGTFTGAPFRGIPPSGGPIGQNIMDFYIRRGDKLAENWVLIDLIDFAAQCGVDLLAQVADV